MRIIAFAGTRTLDPAGAFLINDVLMPLRGADEYVTDGTKGVGAYVGAFMARASRQSRQRIIVPAGASARFGWWSGVAGVTINVTYPPRETTDDDHSKAIVDACTELVLFPQYPEHDLASTHSKTWQMVRMARVVDKPHIVHVLNKPVEV